jgi:hypothetical protein
LGHNGGKYCLDTSGLSKPLEDMPEDIHTILWSSISQKVISGIFAVTKEIYDELIHIPGNIGQCIKDNCSNMQFEVGEEDWNWELYLKHVERMRITYKAIISEYNSYRRGTVGLNDISIIALGGTLHLPVISMEKKNFQPSATKMRIPQVCESEGVLHMDFNEFLRAEGIKT